VGGEPIVTDTGCTVTLLHRVYHVLYPDGTTEELIPVNCKREASDEYIWVLRRAKRTWAKRITSTTGSR
jgi:hypothetical protein